MQMKESKENVQCYPQIYASVGVHPCELEGKDPSVAELLALADDDNIIAIGETGLDYFHGNLTQIPRTFKSNNA
jgi:Tat protein secretion system quality control protein TatD with DNase activity